MDLNTIFFIGPQGSGKGTQAKLLAKRLDFYYWEMGGILRDLKNETSPLAEQVTKLINEGVLLPDEILLEVVKSKLSDIKPEQGIIFDGIPRRIGQAEFLFNFLKAQGRSEFTTLFVNLPKEESIKRIMLRAEKENRADDTPEKIEFRLKQYEKDTLPVVDYLKEHTRFMEISGLPKIEQVTEDINAALEL